MIRLRSGPVQHAATRKIWRVVATGPTGFSPVDSVLHTVVDKIAKLLLPAILGAISYVND